MVNLTEQIDKKYVEFGFETTELESWEYKKLGNFASSPWPLS